MTESFYERFKDLKKGELGDCLVAACQNNNLEEVRYLLTSPELKRHANVHILNGAALTKACEYGNIGIVKYLLTSPELKVHACIRADQNQAIKMACRRNHIDIVKYMLTSPELEERVNIHSHKDSIFITAVKLSRIEIIQYLIYDLNIELTTSILGVLHNRTTPTIDKVKHMFYMRRLNEKLKVDLVKNDAKQNLVKI